MGKISMKNRNETPETEQTDAKERLTSFTL